MIVQVPPPCPLQNQQGHQYLPKNHNRARTAPCKSSRKLTHQQLHSSWIFEQLPNNQRGATVFHLHHRPRVLPPVAASIKCGRNDHGHNHPHQTRVRGNGKSINNIVKGSMNAFNSLLGRNSGGGGSNKGTSRTTSHITQLEGHLKNETR